MEGWNKVWKIGTRFGRFPPTQTILWFSKLFSSQAIEVVLPHGITHSHTQKPQSVPPYQTQPPHSFTHLYPTLGWNSEVIKQQENKMQGEQPIPGIKSSFFYLTLVLLLPLRFIW